MITETLNELKKDDYMISMKTNEHLRYTVKPLILTRHINRIKY
jgi:hypothetical protein